MRGVIPGFQKPFLVLIALACAVLAACVRMPVPTAAVPTPIMPPRPVTTPQSVIVAQATNSPTRTRTATATGTTAAAIQEARESATVTVSTPEPVDHGRPTPLPSATPPPTVTSLPVSFLQQRITNLYDLSRLPVMENTTATQFTSRNWKSLEHYFDYFFDDGSFVSPNYGFLDEGGGLVSYRMATGYDGRPEYEIVPRVEGPGSIERIWFAYQQHASVNNPQDMSQSEEWANWGNLGEMGNIRFYFDDESTPRIDFGIKDLFVGKNPFPAPLSAFYASADGGNITYVPIPFQKSIRIATTGRPRLMQIEVKQLPRTPLVTEVSSATASAPLTTVDSFQLNLSSGEQAALDQAGQAWQTCTPSQPGTYQTFSLPIPHNESAEVDFPNSATISGLRVRIPRGMEDSVWVQVFWDGEAEPSMTAPLRGMFGTAERLLTYRSLPLGTYSENGDLVFYNNIPMPFNSARLVFVNDRAETLPITLEVALRETVPGSEKTRLHAFYGTRRMERREDDQDNYVVIDVPGSGKYLGTIFSAWELDRRALNGPLPEKWRFPYLESNMDVWVDGKLALPGTGIEDDFNASYYYVYAGYEGYKSTYCLAGLTLLDYGTSKEPSSQYRFYLNDAPEFKSRLSIQVQHGNKGNNLSVTYSSTAFWYQIRP